MTNKIVAIALSAILAVFVLAPDTMAGNDSLYVEHSDRTEVQLADNEYIVYFVGHVVFRNESGRIFCDSAVYRERQSAMLRGHVVVDDTSYTLRSDSAFYNEKARYTEAWGKQVELFSYSDSIYATGPYAYFDRKTDYFYMNERPTLYLKYPDSANMVEVISDSLEYQKEPQLTVAVGNVSINSNELSSHSGQALLNMATEYLELNDKPTATHGNSTVTGRVIGVDYDGDMLSSIQVVDSAKANFREPTDSTETYFDESVLTGHEILFTFEQGVLQTIVSTGQAYSWYYPSPQGGTEFHDNSVSGDTIQFIVENQKQLRTVLVQGGAIGSYVHGKQHQSDTLMTTTADTVDYSSEMIDYNLADSLITLYRKASIESGTVSLVAHRIGFDTREGLIEAYSADVPVDTALDPGSFTVLAQPRDIPVVLHDGDQELVGDFLEYSLETKKGRILRSKTKYDPGFYYGSKLFREHEDIYYIDQGRFTTCENDEPHFHFRSSHLKLIEGDKLIARPVVAYLGRLPVLAFPYYVFPLKKGRHSGIVPFQFGNFERDVRYVTDIGYFWAASDYFDWLGTLDYYDNANTITLKTRMNFAKRYEITNTYIEGRYTRKDDYDQSLGVESRQTDYVFKANYNHDVSPSLTISGYGDYVSSEGYYAQYSPNLNDRLNRELTSQITVKKTIGTGTSVTALARHVDRLDYESRSDVLPQVSVSLPVFFPFGNGSGDDQRWYHGFKFRYSPSLVNKSSRETLDTGFVADTSIIATDSTNNNDGTWTITAADTSIVVDTLSYRSRKKFAKIQHNPTITLPTVKLADYISLVPSFGYEETWFDIFETDQSRDANIPARTYRTHSWRAALSAATTLYGTVRPNLFGLLGLRQVLSPAATYSYTPDINEHPEVRSYADGGAGSNKSSKVSFDLKQDYMAKIASGDDETTLSLFWLKSSFGYDFENTEKPYSDLITSYGTDVIPSISINGSVTHSFYEPGTNDLHFWSPYRMAFSFNTKFSLGGPFPLFDESTTGFPQGADSASDLSGETPTSQRGRWRTTVDYQYSESGRGSEFSKKSVFIAKTSFNFNLTASTSVSVSHNYNILDGKTVNNSVSIVRKIHCWTGSLYWVPTGSNRGFGFKLFVTEIPEIKIDNGHDSYVSRISGR